MSKHHYDRCDGGICLNCDLCLRETCCPQDDECHGHNWDFLNKSTDEWMEHREASITFDSELRNSL